MGLIYPDVFILWPTLSYSVSHLIDKRLFRKSTMLHAQANGNAKAFAAGIYFHLRDDRRLPIIANSARKIISPLSQSISEILASELTDYSPYTLASNSALRSQVASAVVEFHVASKTPKEYLSFSGMKDMLSEPALMTGVKELWNVDDYTVQHMNGKWSKTIDCLSRFDVEELVEYELKTYWPKLIAGGLFQGKLISARETVVVRHAILKNLPELHSLLRSGGQKMAKSSQLMMYLDPPLQKSFVWDLQLIKGFAPGLQLQGAASIFPN